MRVRNDRGAVSAEFAVAVPSVLVVVALVVGCMVSVADSAAMTSQAAQLARLIALGAHSDLARGRAHPTVGLNGSSQTFDIRESDSEVCVIVSRKGAPWLTGLGLTASGTGCAIKVL